MGLIHHAQATRKVPHRGNDRFQDFCSPRSLSIIQELLKLCLEVCVFLPGLVEEGKSENGVVASLKDRFDPARLPDLLQKAFFPTVDLFNPNIA